ncbi:MAG: glycosyltransferase family 4 protein [Dietzia maris]
MKESGEPNYALSFIAGIFGRDQRYTSALHPTTETVLFEAFSSSHQRVRAFSPRAIASFLARRRWNNEIVHIHHPGRLTTIISLLPVRSRLVYTPHRTYTPSNPLLGIGHDRMIRRRADVVVALSPAEADLIEARFSINRNRIAIIPNGFALPDISLLERKRPLSGNPWRLLFVGQLVGVKRPMLLVELVSALAKSHNVELVLVSQNPELLDDMMVAARSYGVAHRIVFRGQLGPSALAAEYEEAHALLLPSYAEALPSVIIEAVKSGLPVVASDVGGVRWQLDGLGVCKAIASAEELVDAVRELLRNYDTYASESYLRAESVVGRFSEIAMIEQHQELYRSLASEEMK